MKRKFVLYYKIKFDGRISFLHQYGSFNDLKDSVTKPRTRLIIGINLSW